MIDLRSDTVTHPTPEMRRAMAEAEVGDDVYLEDPTVRRLEEHAAALFEREAALFVPSGTMGNQIAIRVHTNPGEEVIAEARSHVVDWEMAAMAAISGCLPRVVSAPCGRLQWSLLEPALSPPVYYRARTGLIVLENTHNMAGGTVTSLESMDEIVAKAHGRGLPVHLDGARIFNAAIRLGVSVARASGACDSVMFCLSKGLSAPVGSLLVGRAEFIEEARRVRKLLGGGMHQAGVLAAAGLVALEIMPDRLADDHRRARRLAEGLAEMPGFGVDLEAVETNIVVAKVAGDVREITTRLAEEGILCSAVGPDLIRFVAHRQISDQDIEKTLTTIRDVSRRMMRAPVGPEE
ncbi:MAG TPA: GntG family PLP-dependent aldolase [Acidobacteriota bacterium]|nr:GntG family PLP-dependent aldolase [Acidobacteriota bacterium]HRV07212.1 GntG family PLP-dependent aldolase [Acidobacteriota bacterium]